MKRAAPLLLIVLVVAEILLTVSTGTSAAVAPRPDGALAAAASAAPTEAPSFFDAIRPKPTATLTPTPAPTALPLGRAIREQSNAMVVLRPPQKIAVAPVTRLIPDSELVNGPAAAAFNMTAFLAGRRGYITRYSENVREKVLSGEQIIDTVAYQFSVNPRLLLALLEWQGGWVDNPSPAGNNRTYPFGEINAQRPNLYLQVAWAAARLNEGYYGWRLGTRDFATLDAGGAIGLPQGINAGTAGLMNFIAAVAGPKSWEPAMAPGGFLATYRRLFGDPTQYDTGAPVPAGTRQPRLRLPWAEGETWLLTGGPHSPWGVGGPWGAVDFTTNSVSGCRALPEWTLAVADGVIARSRNGEVGLALHPSGDERIGWAVFYMHIYFQDRVETGARVRAGEQIGHPSCEGGLSIASHLHIGRKLNGEWLSATSAIPYTLGDWTFSEDDAEYDGFAVNGPVVREAAESRNPDLNGIR
ncbi:MAG TPA: hypothetical protein PLG23_04815 [Thermoflexales bacterium]|jgi:hypothetical protein|nr:hypothetical protein [Anaerolineae bacterium]HQX11621.1 hypothetical protein [Thermoflexales bacterium]HQZ52760.1 hypothetical protein [Thermoflexales bacterium]HRA54299.1 hypothetical protein [Thermoflexales bacterium]